MIQDHKMQTFRKSKPTYSRLFLMAIVLLLFTCIFCELFIYYVQFMFLCKWPSNATVNSKKVMVLSDIHLLGKIKGHWFDKFRREWQMFRSFQTAVNLFNPEFVFVLGDVFDEGQWANQDNFRDDVSRFFSYFHVPEHVKLYVVAGNHDIGFHYNTYPFLYTRFDQVMNTSTVDHFNLTDDILVVRINSIALENDGCSLCHDAQRRLTLLSQKIAKNPPSKVVVLTHFPLYRKSESLCSNDTDSISEDSQNIPNREAVDCLTLEASNFILHKLKPSLILNGHVHYSCRRERELEYFNKNIIKSEEITVSSFNWRNRNSPSFLLLQLDSNNHWSERCHIPNELLVFFLYTVAFVSSIILILCSKFKFKYD